MKRRILFLLFFFILIEVTYSFQELFEKIEKSYNLIPSLILEELKIKKAKIEWEKKQGEQELSPSQYALMEEETKYRGLEQSYKTAKLEIKKDFIEKYLDVVYSIQENKVLEKGLKISEDNLKYVNIQKSEDLVLNIDVKRAEKYYNDAKIKLSKSIYELENSKNLFSNLYPKIEIDFDNYKNYILIPENEMVLNEEQKNNIVKNKIALVRNEEKIQLYRSKLVNSEIMELTKDEIEILEIDLKTLEIELQNEIYDINIWILSKENDLKNNYLSYKNSVLNLEILQEEYNSIAFKYKESMGKITDLNSVLEEKISAELEILKNIIEYNKIIAELEIYY